jgi:autotransporter passenger strand-loop-strand repeat protein
MNGEQLVQGTASRTTIYGKQIVESGGTSVGSTVKFGAFENVLPGGTAQNTTIGASGTLYLANGANATGAIIFFGSNGVLQIAGAALPSAPISNFDINNSTGDEITLTGFTYAAAHDSVTLGAGNVLMLNLNGVSKDLYLNPSQNYNHDSFSIKTNTQDQVVVFGSLATAQPMVFLSRDSGAIPATPITDLRNLFSDIRTAGSASATLPPSILVGFPNKLETQTFSGIASILADLRMQQTPLTAAAKLLAHHG